jgi:hypothetical protein
MVMMGVADTDTHHAISHTTEATQPLVTIGPRPGWVSHRQPKRRRIHHGAARLALPMKRREHTDSFVACRRIKVER